MSALLHPVGPEPERTYWLRRAVVLAVVLLLVAVLTSVIGNLTGGRRQVTAAPAAASPSTSVPSVTPSVMGTASTAGTPSPSTSSSASSSTKAKATAKATAKDKETANAQASAKPKAAPTKAAAPLCDPARLRATITGKQRLKPEDDTTFQLSFINGTASTCHIDVTAANFELKIYSGTDRIWSSRDCDTSVKTISRAVAAEQAVEWKMTWNGRRSKAGCKSRKEIPKPGTYFATSQLTGAKPVQLRMILHG